MRFFLGPIVCLALAAQSAQPPALHLANGPEVDAALARVSEDSLRGHLSFLSSDALEGRGTPSRGLDIAAEYIAAQFRRAGLEAPVQGTYFETADFLRFTPVTQGLTITFDETGRQPLRIEPPDAAVLRGNSSLDLQSVPLFKLTSAESVPDEVAGKAVLLPARRTGRLMRTLRQKKAALIVSPRLQDGDAPASTLIAADQADTPTVPTIGVRGDACEKLFESLPAGLTKVTITVHAPAPVREAVKLRNVIGAVRGSDSQLSKTYVMVTAHYDHLGMKAQGEGDRIYNGANDDGSGTVSVIELASAIASMHPHPRRTVVFMCVFGEEEGLLGSRYYARHPVFPLRQTVADINLEQIGRTDDSQGPQIKEATFTGYTYSNLPALFAAAGKVIGVKVYDRNIGNDPFFSRSDNQALADAGIPSHTVAVALDFPDYHQTGDEWHKIDYTNMALVDRMLALGLVSLAEDPETPKWNQANPNTAKYVNAWKSLKSPPEN